MLDGVAILLGVLEGCPRFLGANQMSSSLIPMLAMSVLLWDPGGAFSAASEMKVKCFFGRGLGETGIGSSLPVSSVNANRIFRSFLTLVGMGSLWFGWVT